MLQELVIKTEKNYDFKEEFLLSGESFILRVYYNARGSHWNVDLSTERGVLIVGGLKMMPNRNLLEGLSYLPNIPSGELWCVDTTGALDNEKVTLGNFGQGKKYTIWYRS